MDMIQILMCKSEIKMCYFKCVLYCFTHVYLKKIEENKVQVKLLYKLFINRLLLLLLNKKLFSKIILIFY
jgi:hypothetical protein